VVPLCNLAAISFLLKFREMRIAIRGVPLLPNCYDEEGLANIKGVAERDFLRVGVRCSVRGEWRNLKKVRLES
jgi:hypothetical protein